MCNPHLRGKELCFLSFSVENLYKLFKILLHGTFVSSPTFINLFNHLFIPVWTHGYFILWVIIQHYFTYCVAQIVPASVISSFQLALMSLCFDIPPLLWSFFELSYFLILQDAPDSCYIFPAPDLQSTISQRSPGWFYWRMILHPRFGQKVCNSIFFFLGALKSYLYLKILIFHGDSLCRGTIST